MPMSRLMMICKRERSSLPDENRFWIMSLIFISKKKNDHGFTMLELIIVMAVIGLVVAVSVPRLGGAIANMKIRSAVRTCSAVLRYAKSMAVTTQQELTVSFVLKADPEEMDYYTYEKVTRKTPDSDEWTESDEDIEGREAKTKIHKEKKRQELDQGLSMSWRNDKDSEWEDEGAYEIAFFPRGFASGGEIRFAWSDRGSPYILGIDPVTGRVKTFREEK